MKKLLAAILTFISFAASANTILYNTDTPYPTTDTLESACTSRAVRARYSAEGIHIPISKMHKCANGDYVAQSEIFADTKYFKIPADHDLILLPSKADATLINPEESLTIEISPILTATDLLIRNYSDQIENKFIFNFQLKTPTQYGMDDSFNFQIANQSLPSYTPANTIKYIEVVVNFYNPVGDRVKTKTFTGVGPITTYGVYEFDSQFYNTIETGKIKSIKLTFMNGKTKSLSPSAIRVTSKQQQFFNTNCWFNSKMCLFQR